MSGRLPSLRRIVEWGRIAALFGKVVVGIVVVGAVLAVRIALGKVRATLGYSRKEYSTTKETPIDS